MIHKGPVWPSGRVSRRPGSRCRFRVCEALSGAHSAVYGLNGPMPPRGCSYGTHLRRIVPVMVWPLPAARAPLSGGRDIYPHITTTGTTYIGVQGRCPRGARRRLPGRAPASADDAPGAGGRRLSLHRAAPCTLRGRAGAARCAAPAAAPSGEGCKALLLVSLLGMPESDDTSAPLQVHTVAAGVAGGAADGSRTCSKRSFGCCISARLTCAVPARRNRVHGSDIPIPGAGSGARR